MAIFYRRKLPHWHPEPTPGNFLFVTWRLAGSLPRSYVGQALSPAKNSGRTFVTIDRKLDQATSGPLWLKDPRIAAVVKDALLYGEQQRLFYKLASWVIMPNHIHVLLEPKIPLPKILRWVKGSTAQKANEILHRTGNAFWQDESFDHWVRNDREFDRIVRYVEHNPVTAGFVESPADWPWSSAHTAGGSACPTLLTNFVEK